MAQNSIEIFDDTVLKLTVNQGTESERSITTVGNFTMGELAFTRDTGRLFVGDCSDDNTLPTTTESGEINYTKGGILVGNRYLGIIDSKPLAESSNGGAGNGIPLNFEEKTPVGIDNIFEKAMIGSTASEITETIIGDAKFKKEMIVDGDDEGQKTAYRWNRAAEYNEQYDAYNGDILYDVYNNALILFDKNIDPDPNSQTDILENGHPMYDDEHGQYFKDKNNNPIYDINDKVNVKRRTPILNLGSSGTKNDSVRYNVYGKGYVVFRNIEPDNETLEFISKEFDGKTGEAKTDADFSHNVLRIKNLPIDKVSENFNDAHFTRDEATNKISIVDTLSWVKEIGTSSDVSSLKIPSKINVKHGDTADNFTIEKINSGVTKSVLCVKKGSSGYTITAESPVYSFKLGNGLTSTNGKQVDLGTASMPTVMLDTGAAGNVGYTDPYWIEEDSITPVMGGDSYSYISQYAVSGGLIMMSGEYEQSYVENAAEWIEKYHTDKNTTTNFLKTPIALTWTTATGSAGPFSINVEFYNGDHLFCLNGKVYSQTGESSSTSVKIFTNGAPATGKAPLDIDNASISGTKNAYRYYSQVDYEMAADDITPTKLKINESQFKIVEWQYNSQTNQTIINGSYTSDEVSDTVDEIKIGNLQLWKNNAKGTDFNSFNTVKESAGDNYVVYSICIDAKDLISNVYHKITYSLMAEEGEEQKIKSIDLVKNGYVKFIQSLQLVSENNKWYVGPNKEYEVGKFYECNDFNTGVLNEFTPTSEDDIKSKNSIVLATVDPSAVEEENPVPYFLFYKLVNCPENEKYKTKEVTSDDYKVRIPMHAKNALVEVTVYKSSGEEEIGVFTANKFTDLKTSFTNENTPYEHSAGEQPILHTTGMLNPGENEVILAGIKAGRYTNTIEVPILHDEVTDKPYFVLRFGNINTNVHFIAKLIGYTV